jgi:hypothetical protein
MSLYNVKSANHEYRVTKFDDELHPESSYITTETNCDCPAGHRDTCRHREMLPAFTEKDRVDSPWFYDFDNDQWFWYDAENARFLNAPPKPLVKVNGRFEGGLWRRI